MEQSFADLFSDAFSETAVPSFTDGDLDFENLHFDEKFEEDKTDMSQENLPTKEDGALQQEITGQTAVLSRTETNDAYMAENADGEQCDDESSEEDFAGVGVMSWDKTLEEDKSSDGESEEMDSVSGEGEEDEGGDMGTGDGPGHLSKSDCCSDEFRDGNREYRIFAEGQPLAPEGAEHSQVRNDEQGESERDEEASYFERFPGRGSEMMIRGDGIEANEQEREEEKEDDSCDSACERMKIELEENVLAPCFEQELEHPWRDDPAKASLEFPEISVQNLQYLIAEVDSEKCGEKMKDFSGEEHQDAGESFADYPSDFSSCEYVEDGGKKQERYHQANASASAADSGSTAKQNTGLERAEDADEKGDGRLHSRDLEVDADEFRSLGVAAGEKEIVENMSGDEAVTGVGDGGESDSYTSSDDDEEERSDEELFDTTCLPVETRCGSSAEFPDFYRADPADFSINWNLDPLTTDSLLSEDLLTTDEVATPLSDVTRRPAGDVTSYSAVQRGDDKTTNPSNQGSLDDIFFFNTEPEASGITELGQLGDDDEYEEERNWEQEQERIKAFYEFYHDSDGEHEREGRQIKVQFCADPLSQVIHYETDSSDRDSLSSSTEGEEDLSSAEASEESREPDEVTPDRDPLKAQPLESVTDISDIPACTRTHKCFNMLKLTLKMGLVILAGLLMFWFATDQVGWFSQESSF